MAVNVGNELKKFFALKGIRQDEIAEKLDVSQQFVSKLLSSNASFGKQTAAKWSDVFGLNPAWLRTGEGNMLLEGEGETNDDATANAWDVIQAGSEAFSTMLFKMVEQGKLYPASIVMAKENEIYKLNREIGKLTLELEQAKQEIEQLKNGGQSNGE